MGLQLVDYKTAKLAKEKGFNLNCSHAYIGGELKEKEVWSEGYSEGSYASLDEFEGNWNKKGWLYTIDFDGCFGCKEEKWLEACSVPTQALLQKWLREEHKLYVYCSPITYGTGKIIEWQTNFSIRRITNRNFKTYEEALEDGLFESLKLIT